MRRIFLASLMGMLVSSLAFGVDIKSQIGEQDINFGSGTFQRRTSTGGTITVNKIPHYFNTDAFIDSLNLYGKSVTGDNTAGISGYKSITGPGTGSISGFDNLTLTGNISGDSTGNLSGFDNATFTGRVTTATLTVTGSPTFADNTINGADLIDNTLNGTKVVDNTLTVGKVSATGTASNSTYLRGDGSWGTPSITTSNEILTSYKNLKITTPADNQSVTITADSVVAVDNTNTGRVLSTVSLTVNLDVSGANGLDNGTIAANTGYFIYVIDNGATTAGLASVSATSPVMPSGYTYKALVGWCTTDNTATPFNIEEFTQVDDDYFWAVPQVGFNSTASAGTTASINFAAGGALSYAVVPPNIAKRVSLRLNASESTFFFHPSTFSGSLANNNSVTSIELYNYSVATVSSRYFEMPIHESQTIYWQADGAATTKIYISGFTLKR